ncbi:MAG TPA: hypothetical protein VKT82_28090 [Ktedonobacterales bacterium]|nr:hypothetical protein [Ktedonobacterales bacterium]
MDENAFEEEPATPLTSEQGADDLSQAEPELESARLSPRRKRVLQISMLLVALVALLVTLRGVVLPQPAPGGPLPLPTIPPPATLIMSNISFGTVTINGQRQRGTVPMLLVEQATTYTITINAPPFRAKSCTFSFHGGTPQNYTSNFPDCTVSSGSGGFPEMTLNGVTRDPTSSVMIVFTAADLPADQQNQINTLLAHSVTAQQSTAVPSGSYIATGLDGASHITSQLTTAALRATAFLAPNANFGPIGLDCVGLTCPNTLSADELTTRPGMLWDILVPVALRWDFMASDGSAMGDVSFPAASVVPGMLAYANNAGWSLSSQPELDSSSVGDTFSNLDCLTGAQILQQQLRAITWNGNEDISEGQGMNGCEITLQDAGGSGRGSFFWRFGVLLAGDDAAHHLLPALPVAPAAEINAVQS